MHDLMKPIVVGALIIAIGVFLGAQRIAYAVSIEGKWDSCVKTFNNETTKKALGLTDAPASWAEHVCLKQMLGTNN